MRHYEKYKASGIDWISDIPAHWQVKKGKYIFDFVNGYPFDSKGFSNNPDAGLPIIRIRDLQNHFSKIYWGGEEISEAIVNDGDLLIGMDGDFNISKWRGGRALLNQRVCKVVGTGIQNNYLYYSLPYCLNIINDLTYYTTVKHLSNEDLWNVFFPVPESVEQTAIANYLDVKTLQMDTLIEKKAKLIELLKEERKAIIDTAVSGQGKNWDRKKLRYIADIIDCKHMTPSYVESGISVVSTGNVKPFQISLDETRRVSLADFEALTEGGRKPMLNDIIYSRNASVGSAALVRTNEQFCLGQDICLIRSNQNQEFVENVLNSNVVLTQMESILVGSTFRRINIQQIKDFIIPVPSMEQQTGIVAYLHEATNMLDQTMARVERELQLIQEYRTSLISEVVTGKVKVV